MNGSTPGLADCGAIAIGAGDSRPDRMAPGSRGGRAGSATTDAGLGGTGVMPGGGTGLMPGGMPAGPDAAGRGVTGLLARGAFGSQFLLRSTSAASCSGVRCCTLLTNGTGALVT